VVRGVLAPRPELLFYSELRQLWRGAVGAISCLEAGRTPARPDHKQNLALIADNRALKKEM